MTHGAIGWDKIGTHLSSSCIISSYFWMTLAPSGDSRHLQRRWDFTRHAKGYIQYLPSGQRSKTPFLWGIWNCISQRLLLEMHDRSEIHLLIWRVGHTGGEELTGGGDAWIWRRGSGCAAGAPGPTGALLRRLACSCSLVSSLRRSGVFTYKDIILHLFLKHLLRRLLLPKWGCFRTKGIMLKVITYYSWH